MNDPNSQRTICRSVIVIGLLAGTVIMLGGYVLLGRGEVVTRNEKQEIDTRVADLSAVNGLVLDEQEETVNESEFGLMKYEGALEPAMLNNSGTREELTGKRPAMPMEEREANREKGREQPVPLQKPVAGPGGAGPLSGSEAYARESAARTALTEAIFYEYKNFNANKDDLAAKYKEVVSKFPGTSAAKRAAGMMEAIQKRYR
jgi:hypothetical protein